MTIQTPKPRIQHRDHNNSKKFRKSPSVSNSEYPMGQREPSWFHFPCKYLCLGTFYIFLPSAQAYRTAQTSSRHSPCTDFWVFPPLFFFLRYVPWHEGNDWPGQRTCLLSPSFIYSGIHTAQQAKKSRGLPYKETPAPRSDAEDQL